MIELHINEGPYEGVEETSNQSKSVDDVTTQDAPSANRSKEAEKNIFAMAQVIMERSSRHRSLRRASNIF